MADECRGRDTPIGRILMEMAGSAIDAGRENGQPFSAALCAEENSAENVPSRAQAIVLYVFDPNVAGGGEPDPTCVEQALILGLWKWYNEMLARLGVAGPGRTTPIALFHDGTVVKLGAPPTDEEV